MDFYSDIVTGILYLRDEVPSVQSSGGIVSLSDFFRPFQDKTTVIKAHHWPEEPYDKDRWGAGCCLLESSGVCPAGHHKHPAYLFSWSFEGIFREKGIGDWWLEPKTGDPQPFPLGMLLGHRVRIVAMVVSDQSTEQTVDLGQLESKLAQMKRMFNELMSSVTSKK